MEKECVLAERGSWRKDVPRIKLVVDHDKSLAVCSGYGHGFSREWCILVGLFLAMSIVQSFGMLQISESSSKAGYLALRLQEKGQRASSSRWYGNWRHQSASRKLLGRNATMPLHGAVKDFGYVNDIWMY